jgi:hypothetical protein
MHQPKKERLVSVQHFEAKRKNQETGKPGQKYPIWFQRRSTGTNQTNTQKKQKGKKIASFGVDPRSA